MKPRVEVTPAWTAEGRAVIHISLEHVGPGRPTRLELSLDEANALEQALADAVAYHDIGPPPADYYDDPPEDSFDP
jgi:hypothetical protein